MTSTVATRVGTTEAARPDAGRIACGGRRRANPCNDGPPGYETQDDGLTAGATRRRARFAPSLRASQLSPRPMLVQAPSRLGLPGIVAVHAGRIEEGLRQAGSLLVPLPVAGEHRHGSSCKDVVLQLDDVCRTLDRARARDEDQYPIGGVLHVVVLPEDAEPPRMGEHRLDRLFPGRAEAVGLRRLEAADLKHEPFPRIDRLSAVEASRPPERIGTLDIEVHRGHRELCGAAAARAGFCRIGRHRKERDRE